MRHAITLLLLVCCPSIALSQSTPGQSTPRQTAPLQLPRTVAVYANLYELSLTKLQNSKVTIAGVSPEAMRTGSFGTLLPGSLLFNHVQRTSEPRPSGTCLVETGVLANVIAALSKTGALTVLAEPKVVTTDGSPGTYSAVGEAPVVVKGADGRPAVGYRKFGTEFECLPVLLGNNRVRLSVRPRISLVDVHHTMMVDGVATPILSVREISTGLDMNIGQTLVVTGLIEKRATDGVMEDIELVITIRVELPEVPKIARLP